MSQGSKLIYCKHCGKPIDADSAFCMHCGGAIQENREASFFRIIDALAGEILLATIRHTKKLINSLKSFYFVLKRVCDRIIKRRLTIPDSITEIENGAYKGYKINHVIIGNSVSTIGESAFEGCKKLIELTIPNSVTTIGNKAFANCDALTHVIIGEGISTIGDGVFKGCKNLASITIPDSVIIIGNEAFAECENLKQVLIGNGVTSIGNSAFSGCVRLVNIEIPNSVISIGANAFEYCKNVATINIPENVTTIGEDAFNGCCGELIINSQSLVENNSYNNSWLWKAKFTKLTIGNKVEKIGSSVFNYCYSLKCVTIADSVTEIGSCAFESPMGTTRLDKVNVQISNLAKYCSSNRSTNIGCGKRLLINGYVTTKIAIPDGVTSIGEGAFEDSTITSVTIPDSVMTIKRKAFADCKNLTNITIGSNIVSIEDYAFDNCNSLTSLIIPNSVTSIGFRTFSGCSSLVNISIPNSVTNIGFQAFGYCHNLKSITIPNSVTSFGHGLVCHCSKLIEIKSRFSSKDNRCLIVSGVMLAFAGAGITEYTIPDGTIMIGEYTFSNNKYLTNITFPNSMEIIGDWSFDGCENLTRLIIPDSVTKIGEYAFMGCRNLEEITIPNSVTSIGKSAFFCCSSLASVYCKAITPPTEDGCLFLVNTSVRKIYVPRNSVNAYKTAKGWKDYADDIVGYDF